MAELYFPPRKRSGAPDWEIERKHWPLADTSRFLQVGRFVWHVQSMGEGPALLLLHGTGAATHSWSGLAPLLATQFRTIVIDLPGHGFTYTPGSFVPTLLNMSKAVGDLLGEMKLDPSVLVGHSAGAAIAMILADASRHPPKSVVSINGALKPFDGFMGMIAPTVAKVFSFGGLAAQALSMNARDERRVRKLLEDTGSSVSADMLKQYHCLMRSSAHIQGTLDMMANWDLSQLEGIIASLDIPILFLAGDRDRAVSPTESRDLANIARKGTFQSLPDLGHLAHEEDPETVAEMIFKQSERA